MSLQLEQIKKAQEEDLTASRALLAAEMAKRDKLAKELEDHASAVIELINRLDGQQQELELIKARQKKLTTIASFRGAPGAGSPTSQPDYEHPLSDLIMQQLVDFNETRSKKRSL